MASQNRAPWANSNRSRSVVDGLNKSGLPAILQAMSATAPEATRSPVWPWPSHTLKHGTAHHRVSGFRDTMPTVSDVIIEFRHAGSASWEHLGRFKVTASELENLKALVARCANVYQLLSRIPRRGIVWNTLDTLKEQGHFARLKFSD